MMKKQYMTPETEVFNIQTEGILLTGSILDPIDHTGGGTADAPLMSDDDVMDFLMGGGDYSDLEKLLF